MHKVLACIGFLVCFLPGCSWENTVHGIASAPERMRLRDYLAVENPPRFSLPADAAVEVSATRVGHDLWLNAANRGVDVVFPNAHASARYELLVVWPSPHEDLPNGAGEFFDLSLLGLHDLPRVATSRRLDIHLTDPNGVAVHSMRLVLAPALWGSSWDAESVLEAGFVEVARTLRGS